MSTSAEQPDAPDAEEREEHNMSEWIKCSDAPEVDE